MNPFGDIAGSMIKALEPKRGHRHRRKQRPRSNTEPEAATHERTNRTRTPDTPLTTRHLMPSYQELDSSLAEPDSRAIATVLGHGLAHGTQNNYSHAVRAFTSFCGTRNIPPDQQLPARESVLCAFAASLASSMSGSAASGVFSGLKTWHALHNAPWLGSDQLKIVLRGVSALAPASSKRKPRTPVTTAMLSVLRDGLDLNDHFDAATFAAATVTFWGQCRLGEMMSSSRTRHVASKIPSRSSCLEPFTAAGSREVILPCTKTRQHEGDRVTILRQTGPADPIWALANHLFINRIVPTDFHLFGFMKTVRGKLVPRCLIKQEFLDRCNAIWTKAGHPRLTGHSFRIGGTTELLLRGVDPEVVRRMGRWASDAHLRYWRKTHIIAAAQAECLPAADLAPSAVADARARRSARARDACAPARRGLPY